MLITVFTQDRRSSVPNSHARGQRFEPRRQQYYKPMLDPRDFHSNPSGLLSFNKSETVLSTYQKILRKSHGGNILVKAMFLLEI